MGNPKRSHGEAVKHIGRYLLETRNEGIFLRPDKPKSFECFCDADYSGNWDHRIAAEDPNTAKSRSGVIIFYAGSPLLWFSKLQIMYALSTAESDFFALSLGARQLIPVMEILKEIKAKGIQVSYTPTVYCKIFEDNSAALEIARVPKMRPRTRHINAIYHHFRNLIANKRVHIHPVDTLNQLADGFTKQTTHEIFFRHRKHVLGW
mmetsp:Transcript_4824/g.7447  ORF Transcript_4824/g.7447 Transcript_4824/m.7447 type:complete len:206 (+) Transcript_4824:270-887(+)